MANKRVITEIKDYEKWRSNIDGSIWIKQFDRRGEPQDVCIAGGRDFRILPEERRVNQEIPAEASMDPFLNGMFVPVELVESAEDYDDLKANPNHLTEVDMKQLLDDPKGIDALRAGLENVSNPTTLVRLLAIAEDPESDCTLRQVRTINDRLQQVSQQSDYQEVETVSMTTSDGREVVGTHAAVAPAPMNPGVGRRTGRD